MTDKAVSEMTFEEAMAALEQVVSQLEIKRSFRLIKTKTEKCVNIASFCNFFFVRIIIQVRWGDFVIPACFHDHKEGNHLNLTRAGFIS